MEKDLVNTGSTERRSGRDRRAEPTSPLTLRSMFGSRRYTRRREDSRKHLFVDLYSPFLLGVLLFTLILSIADGFLTLRLVGGKVEELNPVMGFFLNLGPVQFVLAKWFFTAAGMTTLLVLKNHYFWEGKIKIVSLIVLLPFIYLVLILYEFYLLMNG